MPSAHRVNTPFIGLFLSWDLRMFKMHKDVFLSLIIYGSWLKNSKASLSTFPETQESLACREREQNKEQAFTRVAGDAQQLWKKQEVVSVTPGPLLHRQGQRQEWIHLGEKRSRIFSLYFHCFHVGLQPSVSSRHP